MKQHLLFAVKFFALVGGYFFTRAPSPTNKYRTREKSVTNVAVLFLLENLKRVLLYHTNLIFDSKNQMELLDNDVRLFKAFLIDLSKRRYEDTSLKQLESQIRDLVCEADKTIDDFLVHTAEYRDRNLFERGFSGSMKLVRLAEEVKVIRGKAKVTFEKSRVALANFRAGTKLEKTKDEKVFVASQETESDALIDYVSEESKSREIIAMTRKALYPDLARQLVQENSIAIQESDTNLPLAIGFMVFNTSGKKISMSPF